MYKYDKVRVSGKIYFRYRHWDKVLKKYLKPIYGKTKGELDIKVEKFTKTLAKKIHDDDVLFSVYVKGWLDNVHSVDKKPLTMERYYSIYRNYVENSYVGKIKLKDLEVEYFQNWYNNLKEKKGESIVKNLHKIISPALRYAAKTGRIITNYAEFIVMPKDTIVEASKRKRRKPYPLTLKQHLAFIEHLEQQNSIHAALYTTAVDMGLRQGELFALKWNDIDFDSDTLSIEKTYAYVKDEKSKKMIGIVTLPKSEKSIRTLHLPAHTKNALIKHLNQQKPKMLGIGININGDSLVFSTNIGTHLDATNVRNNLKDIYETLSIDRTHTFHDLRHTYATRLFELGEAPKTVQELLGHANVNITLNTYTHVLDKLKEQTVTKIDSLYGETNNIRNLESKFTG